MLDAMKRDRARFRPKSGYNVVGVDTFEDPGEQLYLIGHADDEPGAKKILAQFKAQNPGGDDAYIYGPAPAK